MTDTLPRIKTFTETSAIDLAPLVRASRLAVHLIRRAFGATGHGLARLPQAITNAFAMAYVDPYGPRSRRDDWSDPSRF